MILEDNRELIEKTVVNVGGTINTLKNIVNAEYQKQIEQLKHKIKNIENELTSTQSLEDSRAEHNKEKISKMAEKIKILEKTKETVDLQINSTRFEVEIAKLKSQSEEWSIFTGYAMRQLKGTSSEKCDLPFKLCPFCCQPVAQADVPKKNFITLTYKPLTKEYADSGDRVYHGSNYRTYLPEDCTEGDTIEAVIPLSLWIRCKKIKHDDWHNKYMNRYIGDPGQKVFEISKKAKGENNIIAPRIDSPENWLKDIKGNYKIEYGKRKFKGKLENYALVFFNNPEKYFEPKEPGKILKKRKIDGPEESTCYSYKDILLAIWAIEEGKNGEEGKFKLRRL